MEGHAREWAPCAAMAEQLKYKVVKDYERQYISGVDGWRVGVVFVLCIVVGWAFEYGMEHVDEFLKHNNLRGLRNTFHKFRDELLTLGFISLVLAAAGEYIGSTGFLKQEVVHHAHIFLFAVGGFHISFAALALALAVVRIRLWQPWEDAAKSGELDDTGPIDYEAANPTAYERLLAHLAIKPLSVNAQRRAYARECRKYLHRETNSLSFHLSSAAQVLRARITEPAYLGLRRLFVARMHVDADFDVLGFVRDSMEEEFSAIIGTSSQMWILVAVWLALPPSINFPLVISAVAFLCTCVVSYKVESAVRKLTRLAFKCFGSFDNAMSGVVARSSMEISFDTTVPFGNRPFDPPAAPAPEPVNESFASETLRGVRAIPSRAPDAAVSINIPPATKRTVPGAAASSVDFDTPRDGAPPVKPHPITAARQESALWRLDGVRRLDAATLFWFGKPRLLLTVLNFTVFECSMSLAFIAYANWQDKPLLDRYSLLPQGNSLGITAIVLAVDIVLLLHTALYVMPSYALVSSLGSHCPETVLEGVEKSVTPAAQEKQADSEDEDEAPPVEEAPKPKSPALSKLARIVREKVINKNRVTNIASANSFTDKSLGLLAFTSLKHDGEPSANGALGIGNGAEDSEGQKPPTSLTNLLGAMVQRKLRVELEGRGGMPSRRIASDDDLVSMHQSALFGSGATVKPTMRSVASTGDLAGMAVEDVDEVVGEDGAVRRYDDSVSALTAPVPGETARPPTRQSIRSLFENNGVNA